MVVAVLGSHIAAALIGVGMSVVVFACAKIASGMNARAAATSSVGAFGWHSFRLLFGLFCGALIAFPWLHLFLDLRIPLTEAASLMLAFVASAYLFIKFKVFGKVTIIGIGSSEAS